MTKPHCNFCGASIEDVAVIVVSDDTQAAICGDCIRICAASLIPTQVAAPATANFPCGSLGEEIHA